MITFVPLTLMLENFGGDTATTITSIEPSTSSLFVQLSPGARGGNVSEANDPAKPLVALNSGNLSPAASVPGPRLVTISAPPYESKPNVCSWSLVAVAPLRLISMRTVPCSKGELTERMLPVDAPGLKRPPGWMVNAPEREPLPVSAPLEETVKPPLNEWPPLPARVNVAGLTPLPTRNS